MTDRWMPIDDAARQVRVRVETIRVWATRGKVATRGRGATREVHMGDLLAAEHAWRVRARQRQGTGVT